MKKLALVLLAVAGPVAAQVPPLAVGARLRIETPPRETEGTLMKQTGDTLTIAAEGAVLTPIPSAAIFRIRASDGKSRFAGAKRGAKYGALIGGGFGLMLSTILVNTGGSEEPTKVIVGTTTSMAGWSAVWGGAIGALVGTEKWTTVYSASVRTSASPGRQAERPSYGVKWVVRF